MDDTRLNKCHILLKAEIMTKYFLYPSFGFRGLGSESKLCSFLLFYFSTWNLLVSLEHLALKFIACQESE